VLLSSASAGVTSREKARKQELPEPADFRGSAHTALEQVIDDVSGKWLNELTMGDPRVYSAAERTLLARIRSGLTVMALGFVVARFGLFLTLMSASSGASTSGHNGHWSSSALGIALMTLGADCPTIQTTGRPHSLGVVLFRDSPRSSA
jgi:uncharacterized membrane protein YidH (DUF202 family)